MQQKLVEEKLVIEYIAVCLAEGFNAEKQPTRKQMQYARKLAAFALNELFEDCELEQRYLDSIEK